MDMRAADAAVPVLYIGGYGRSGSTVIDMALGQLPGIFGAGELGNLARHVWENDEYCACGARVRECAIWSRIVERWLEQEPVGTLGRYGALAERIEALRNPLAVIGVTASGSDFREYARLTRKLYLAIRETTGCDIIIDSSKSPSRALALSRVPGLDLSLLHLVRDGRGVAWSMMKTHDVNPSAGVQRPVGGNPALRTAHRWIVFNLLTEFATSRIPGNRSIRLRYEDFTADPFGALAPVLKMLDVAAAAQTSTAFDEIVPEHQVAGSRVRMGGPLRISRDASWEQHMPRADRSKVERRAVRLLRRYGYV
ncbi:sulfotransferase [Palleronia abyssalis]|uniref:Sulfotransferase domain-containing protein n=1 Tax=Palleronia abyssalis TaxID=1501240 RepID=A0A2R8BYL2_9RHOB|nr:sulfotransferase [Palleronia abyssalis]SPJ25219.1 hypothetical protein PAA8504_03069 [Palleronia abyssalis]